MFRRKSIAACAALGVTVAAGASHPHGEAYDSPSPVCIGATETVELIGSPPFRVDRAEVTVERFATFIEATDYITDAERDDSITRIFTGFDIKNQAGWWREGKGASWRNPDGNNRVPADCEPVVQVTLKDAHAFAEWAGGRLPSENEWETAAGKNAWDKPPVSQANYWQGVFPVQNSGADGHLGRAPVASYPPNEFGLYDMVGNVWEMTASSRSDLKGVVIRGGSYLCSENFCRNYSPFGVDISDSGLAASHIGFRLVYDDAVGGEKEE